MIDLVESSKTENSNSYDILFQSCRKSLFLTALVMLENRLDAEDAVQDTAIIAYSSISTLKNNEYFKTWITRILINRCKRIRVTRSRNKTIELTEETLWAEPLTNHAIEVWEAVNKLGKDDKILITLRFFNDLSISEIAAVLKAPIGTMKSKLHRAIKKLRKIMGEEEIR